MQTNNLSVEKRESKGSCAARRMRREGRIPAVIYGAGRPPVTLSIVEKDVAKALDAGSRVFELEMDGNPQQALLKAVQYDFLGDRLVHADFLRLVRGEKVEVRVPLVFKGTPKGMDEGGVLNTVVDSLEISCDPSVMPREIIVDVSGLSIGDSIHVRDLPVSADVEITEAMDAVIVVLSEPDDEAESETPEEGQSAPEVIGGDKGDDEDGK